MHHLIKILTDPQALLAAITTAVTGWWAYVVLFAMVFAETGLLLGFFLPGDSLLFTLGVVAGAGQFNPITITILLIVAAIVGDSTGYALGWHFGPKIFNREESWFFKKAYVDQTQNFFTKHGVKTIIYARFVPVVRTFAPFMAGVGRMDYRKFLFYNVLGGLIWVPLIVMAGYFLGEFDIVKNHFEKVILLIILLSVVPTFIEVIKHKFKR
jgi:membrane-associated protein